MSGLYVDWLVIHMSNLKLKKGKFPVFAIKLSYEVYLTSRLFNWTKKTIKICQININYRMIDFSDVGQLNADLSDNFTVWSDLMLTCQILMTTSYLFTCHILKIWQVDITIWQVVAELHHHIFVMGTFELNFLICFCLSKFLVIFDYIFVCFMIN